MRKYSLSGISGEPIKDADCACEPFTLLKCYDLQPEKTRLASGQTRMQYRFLTQSLPFRCDVRRLQSALVRDGIARSGPNLKEIYAVQNWNGRPIFLSRSRLGSLEIGAGDTNGTGAKVVHCDEHLSRIGGGRTSCGCAS